MDREKIIQKLHQIKILIEECIGELSPKKILKKISSEKLSEIKPVIPTKINFSMNKRAFIKKYSKGMSGPKKFVLILAYLVKGEIGKEKSLDEIKKHWKKWSLY